MFYDRAKIYARSGDGGDGMISFRREKYVPFGGPDGGDGGRGGSVIFSVNPHLNSLIRFHRNNHYRADHGKHGNPKRKTGAQGDDIILEVPAGTIVSNAETKEILADLNQVGQQVVILRGGRGGRGNIHFANSRNQAPRLAERGEPGEEMWLTLELKLIADVGIVGVPNAGKSTLLSTISAAKPKIADYPFTTLQPNLGVVTLDDHTTMVIADIPGLIEGAAQGTGLGHDFLRHIERTKILVHLLDGASSDPLEDWTMINQELALYDKSLDKKPQLVVLNKMDLPDAIAWEPIIEEEIIKRGYSFCSISAVTNEGVRDMLWQVKRLLSELPQEEPEIRDLPTISPKDEDGFAIVREGNAWRVKGRDIERVAAMTYFEFDATLIRFQHILERMGISQALEEAGIRQGDIVYIGDQELEWGE
ncbi:MAG: GTPase ObgE [Candidatus Promineifilaceae bacterium]|nr:GTPase ObgE [Candidatus Promineifilaceae bacterium]